jgi:hypothetical protein
MPFVATTSCQFADLSEALSEVGRRLGPDRHAQQRRDLISEQNAVL